MVWFQSSFSFHTYRWLPRECGEVRKVNKTVSRKSRPRVSDLYGTLKGMGLLMTGVERKVLSVKKWREIPCQVSEEVSA